MKNVSTTEVLTAKGSVLYQGEKLLWLHYFKYLHCQHDSLCLSFKICDLVLVSDSRQEGQNAKSMRMA